MPSLGIFALQGGEVQLRVYHYLKKKLRSQRHAYSSIRIIKNV
jgi:hypothetical protein